MPSMLFTILVDDSDIERIKYSSSGAWDTAGSSNEHNSTTHLTNGAGSFTFAFNGTSVSVYGTVSAQSSSPPVACSVDGAAIPMDMSVKTGSEVLYNLQFCGATGLADNQEHTLTVAANGQSQTFFLDYILYTYPENSSHWAAPAGSLANVVVDDSRMDLISYEGPTGTSTWDIGGANAEYNGTTHGVTKAGATATFHFQGIGIQVYGTLGTFSNGSTSASTVEYIIDDKTSFTQEVSLAQSNQYQNRFFNSDALQNGDHTLVIKATTGGMEYWLDFLVYTASPSFGVPQPGTLLASSTTNSSPSSSLPSHASQSASQSSPAPSNSINNKSNSNSGNTALIAGVSVAAVLIVLCALLSFLLFHYRRRKQRSRNTAEIHGSHDRSGSEVLSSSSGSRASPSRLTPLFIPTVSNTNSTGRLSFSALSSHPYATSTSPHSRAPPLPPLPPSASLSPPTLQPRSFWLPESQAQSVNTTTNAEHGHEDDTRPSTGNTVTQGDNRNSTITKGATVLQADGPSSRPVVQHEDAGVRLRSAVSAAEGEGDEPPEELPPAYRQY